MKTNPHQDKDFTSDATRATAARDAYANANRQALIKLMAEYSLTFKASEFDEWRPTKRANAPLRGLFSNVIVIATNGMLAWFLVPGETNNSYTERLFLGHKAAFEADVYPLFGATEAKPVGTRGAAKPVKPAKLSATEKALELFATLSAKFDKLTQ